MERTPPRSSIRLSSSSGQRFRNRLSFDVPKFRFTYTSVHPARGTTGPSSRSIRRASATERGSRSWRGLMAVRISVDGRSWANPPTFPRGLVDRAVDPLVAGAPAEIAREARATLFQRRLRRERGRREDHPGRADAALRAAL